MATASAADAQSRYDRGDRQDYRQQARTHERWQQAERRYSAGRYSAPRGYGVRTWSYGQRLPAHDSRGYVINDQNRYGLRAPPRGYHYVRSGNDVVFAAVAGGLITAVIAGLFNQGLPPGARCLDD